MGCKSSEKPFRRLTISLPAKSHRMVAILAHLYNLGREPPKKVTEVHKGKFQLFFVIIKRGMA